MDHEAASVLVDKIQIQQVLVNLIRNAVDAMSTATCRLLTIRTAPDQPGFVRVTVADTGPGVAPDVAAQLFKAFVSTKRSEEHTSELQSLMRISYAVFCLKKKTRN